MPTPFLASGGVDEAGMERLVKFALEKGVDGVVFPGFASEVETLSAGERAALLKIVVAAVAGRVPVVAGATLPTGARLSSTVALRRILAFAI